jgi:hypothetical protein
MFFDKKNYRIIYKINKNVNFNFDDFKEYFQKKLQLFYEQNIFIRKFKKVNFVFIDDYGDLNLSNVIFFIDPSKVSVEKINIFINFNLIYNLYLNDFNKLENILIPFLNHELVHVKHQLNSIYFEKAKSFLKKYNNKFNEKLNSGKFEIKMYYRIFFTNFFYNLYFEGIAKFYEKDREYSIDEFGSIYNIIEENAISISNLIIETIKNKQLLNQKGLDFIDTQSYFIGCLIVYSILLAFDFNQEDIFKMNLSKFIRTYEKSVNILNKKYNQKFKILVSYNSNNGIIDYANIKRLIF